MSIFRIEETAGRASLVVSAHCRLRSPTLPECSPCRVYLMIKGIISRSEAHGTQCKFLERLTTKESKSSHSVATSLTARISQNVSPYQKCILPDPIPPTATSSFNGRSKTNGHYMPCPAKLLSPLFLITPVLTGRVGQAFFPFLLIF